MQNNTQIRGIHQAMVMYAQSNRMYFPGRDRNGSIVDANVEYRFQRLLEGNYFTGEYAISPSEIKAVWTTGTVTSANYSYAMLDIDAGPGGRYNEWRDTLNTEAPAIADRNTGTDAAANVESIWSPHPGDWRGSVAYNDNHVVFETTHVPLTRYTPDGVEWYDTSVNNADNLFAADSPDDAMMIHSGK